MSDGRCTQQRDTAGVRVDERGHTYSELVVTADATGALERIKLSTAARNSPVLSRSESRSASPCDCIMSSASSPPATCVSCTQAEPLPSPAAGPAADCLSAPRLARSPEKDVSETGRASMYRYRASAKEERAPQTGRSRLDVALGVCSRMLLGPR